MPASENLHQVSPSGEAAHVSKADINISVCSVGLRLGTSRTQRAAVCHILAAGLAAERQFAAVAKLHPLLWPVVAHALDIAEHKTNRSNPPAR
jgi:hypothetical protein